MNLVHLQSLGVRKMKGHVGHKEVSFALMQSRDGGGVSFFLVKFTFVFSFPRIKG